MQLPDFLNKLQKKVTSLVLIHFISKKHAFVNLLSNFPTFFPAKCNIFFKFFYILNTPIWPYQASLQSS